jgi:hypothetical protein
MLRKLQVLAILSCMLSYAAAGTVSIGTACARGDMRVDSYMVKGNATLFDGSVVETGQATADLRLDKGTEITMSTRSRGTLYRDRLVLQRGESELASNSFQLEANGLRVTPNEPSSRGVVSLKSGNTVEVAALNGSFGVKNAQGLLLANVRPGRVVSFAIQTGANSTPTQINGVLGVVSKDDSGNYYLTSEDGVKYQITGNNLQQYVGKKVLISGTVQAGAAPAGGATSVVALSSIAINGAVVGGMSLTTVLIIGGVVVAGGTGLGVGIYEANLAASPASI